MSSVNYITTFVTILKFCFKFSGDFSNSTGNKSQLFTNGIIKVNFDAYNSIKDVKYTWICINIMFICRYIHCRLDLLRLEKHENITHTTCTR